VDAGPGDGASVASDVSVDAAPSTATPADFPAGAISERASSGCANTAEPAGAEAVPPAIHGAQQQRPNAAGRPQCFTGPAARDDRAKRHAKFCAAQKERARVGLAELLRLVSLDLQSAHARGRQLRLRLELRPLRHLSPGPLRLLRPVHLRRPPALAYHRTGTSSLEYTDDVLTVEPDVLRSLFSASTILVASILVANPGSSARRTQYPCTLWWSGVRKGWRTKTKS